MIRVVIDTNVIVSANIKDEGAEALVLNLVANRYLQLYVSAATLKEYEAVLARPKLRFDLVRVHKAMELIRNVSILVKPSRLLSISPDEPDNRFLECVEAAKADYLVTGNKRHFPASLGNTQVVNARELLEIITPDLQR